MVRFVSCGDLGGYKHYDRDVDGVAYDAPSADDTVVMHGPKPKSKKPKHALPSGAVQNELPVLPAEAADGLPVKEVFDE